MGRFLFDGCSEVETAGASLSSDRGRFEAFVVFAVFEGSDGFENIPELEGFRNDEVSSWGSTIELSPLFAVSKSREPFLSGRLLVSDPLTCSLCRLVVESPEFGEILRTVFAWSTGGVAACCSCSFVVKPVSLSMPPG